MAVKREEEEMEKQGRYSNTFCDFFVADILETLPMQVKTST